MADFLTRMVVRLKSQKDVTDIVQQKIFPVYTAQETDWPYIVYSLTDDIPVNTAGGTTETSAARIKIDMVAKGTPGGYGQLRTLAAAVTAALSGWVDDTSSVWHLESTTDEPGGLLHGQDVLEFHRVSQDYTLWHNQQ
jgi:hypothetical protein